MTFPGRKRFLKSLRAFSFRLAILCLAPYQVVRAFTPGSDRERIYFNAKNLTANPEDPYAEAVARHGGKIIRFHRFTCPSHAGRPQSDFRGCQERTSAIGERPRPIRS